MNRVHTITDDELNAYLDGEFDRDPALKAHVEDWLRMHPAANAQVQRDRELRDMLDAAGRVVEREPVPPRLAAILDRAPASGNPWRQGAATAALVLLAATAGWWAGGQSAPHVATMAGEAETAALFPSADRETSGLLPQTGLQGDVMEQLETGTHGLLRLDRSGLQLEQASTRIAGDRYVRELTYRNPVGEPIRVLVSLSVRPAEQTPQLATLSGQPLVYWTQGRTAVGVTGDVRAEELNRIAGDVRAILADPLEDIPVLPVETGQDTPVLTAGGALDAGLDTAGRQSVLPGSRPEGTDIPDVATTAAENAPVEFGTQLLVPDNGAAPPDRGARGPL